MESLEQQIIKRQAQYIGDLTTNVMELDLKLVQALATISALEKELEGLKNGDTQQSEPNAAGRKASDAKRV